MTMITVAASPAKDKVSGTLFVGPNGKGEVVINIPADAIKDFAPDGSGHLIFSPNQARGLGELMIFQAVKIDGIEHSNFAAKMRRVLEKITRRRPSQEEAGNAFYRSRQDAKDLLRELKEEK
jgi:hypothetical protein